MIAQFEKDSCRLRTLSDASAFWAAFALVRLQSLFLGKPTAYLHTPLGNEFPLGILSGVMVLWCMSLWVAQRHTFLSNYWQEIGALLRGGTICSLMVLAISPNGWRGISRHEFMMTMSAAVLIAWSFRRLAVPPLLRLAGYRTATRLLIIGDGAVADHVERTFRMRKCYNLRRWKSVDSGRCVLSSNPRSNSIESVLHEYGPDEAIIVAAKGQIVSFVQACQEAKTPWQFVPDIEDVGLPNLKSEMVADLPLVTAQASAFNGINLRLKQSIDLILGASFLFLSLPIMLVIWVLVRLDSEGPAMIKQPRLGYKGKVFHIYKFRSMYHNVDDSAHRSYIDQCIKGQAYGDQSEGGDKIFKIAKDKRVTRVGHFLRRYSLDELPQIFNVLKLEMSLVGPRPSMAYELESYQDWHRERLDAVPGLTGLWQVSGRSRLSFNDMVRLDVEYLRNWKPVHDFHLIARTIPTILRGTGL
jgi:exopolysaccharide biosynthesis polyprenyl glycosylphosphotransferase